MPGWFFVHHDDNCFLSSKTGPHVPFLPSQDPISRYQAWIPSFSVPGIKDHNISNTVKYGNRCDRYFVQNPFNPSSLLCKFALVFTELLSKHSLSCLLSSTNEIFWRVYTQLNGNSNRQIHLFTLETEHKQRVIRFSLDLNGPERSS